jgi:hypothetical protein
MGYQAGTFRQGGNSIAIGRDAGLIYQKSDSICIGTYAGNTGVGQNSIAIGQSSGVTGNNSISIGYCAGVSGQFSTSLGYLSTTLPDYSAAIGPYSVNDKENNTIVLGSSGLPLNSSTNKTSYIYSNAILQADAGIRLRRSLQLNEVLDVIVNSSSYTIPKPFSQTIILRFSGVTTCTVYLPEITANDAGMILTIIKLTSGIAVTLVPNSTNTGISISTSANLSGSTSNTTLLPSNIISTSLLVGSNPSYSSGLFWMEATNATKAAADITTTLTNYVDMSSVQNSIGGAKTFTSLLQADAGIQLRDFVTLSASSGYTLTGNSITPNSLGFPLAQNIILNVTGSSSFTLPLISADLALGISINFIKIAADGTIVTINAFSSNFISNSNSYSTTTTTQDTNLLGANSNFTTLTIVKNSSNLYGWAELSNASKAAANITTTLTNYVNTTSNQNNILGVKKFTKDVEVGISGSGAVVARGGINTYDVSTPYNNFCQLYVADNVMNYIMNAGTTRNSFHAFTAYNNANASISALQVGYTAIDANVDLRANTRITLKENIYLLENSTTITASNTLTFPMFQNIIIQTGSANITIYLPAITNDKQLGLTINFIKSSASATQYTVTLIGGTIGSTQQLIATSSQYTIGNTGSNTNTTLLGNSAAMTTLIIAKTSGAYFWAELSNATKAADNAATTYLSKADASTTYVNVSGSSLQTITGQKKFTGGITFDTVQPKSNVGYSNEYSYDYRDYYRYGPVVGTEISQYTIGFTNIVFSPSNITAVNLTIQTLVSYTITQKGIYMINWNVRVSSITFGGSSRSANLVCFGLNILYNTGGGANVANKGVKGGLFINNVNPSSTDVYPGSFYHQDGHDYYYRVRSVSGYYNSHCFTCIYIHNSTSNKVIDVQSFFEDPPSNDFSLNAGLTITRIA